ncbi:hypothetical protein LRD69_27070 [Streptomyces sp. JH14]|uniref:hypothetical protein n=1 Tax=Streptomyces sp. JH14 TaxID=2793630 RepID=UPI0023F918F8|nr:hypothetical protein [Streptomyces sp. JH14]MDF6045741.1 hypothetical protein [Streptomyces sp. JH14]
MESVPVHCPACGRDHAYLAPVYPCPCGTRIAPPVLPGGAVEPITHHAWNDDWVTVRCLTCGRHDQWPRPELCCPCGAVLRIPVRRASESASGAAAGAPPSHIPMPRTAAAPRPAFRPMTIRTGRDAVTAAALYLGWLGYRNVVQPAERPSSRIDLRATGLIAQVDSTTRPTTLRDVECLWLNGLNASVTAVLFSLAGYARDARERADGLAVPLFVMDLTGTPQPVNSPADELLSTGA